ncbi:hypothetical protein KSP40_PGU020831 [Platanthera guangdongensis]|uniref:Uncharacterized protein n=1 Tax=Platanthera guangdongensis TaxID=2320717 RepID=A0ABR2LYG8_9ASPA
MDWEFKRSETPSCFFYARTEKSSASISFSEINVVRKAALHLLCSLSLVAACWIAFRLYSWSLVTHTSETLGLLLIIQVPVVIGVYSLVRQDAQKRSYWRAVACGILGLPAGALVMAFGAIVLGAPIGSRPKEPLDALVSLPAYGSVVCNCRLAYALTEKALAL